MREDDPLEPDVPPEDEDDSEELERDAGDEGLSPEEHFGLTPPD